MVSEHRFLTLLLPSRFTSLFGECLRLLESDNEYKLYMENESWSRNKQGNILRDSTGKPLRKDKRKGDSTSLKIRYLIIYYVKNRGPQLIQNEQGKTTK